MLQYLSNNILLRSISSWILLLLLAVFLPNLFAQSSDDKLSRKEILRLNRQARQAESTGRYERALGLWQTIMNDKPGDYSAYLGIRRSLVELAEYDKALEFSDMMLKIAQH